MKESWFSKRRIKEIENFKKVPIREKEKNLLSPLRRGIWFKEFFRDIMDQ